MQRSRTNYLELIYGSLYEIICEVTCNKGSNMIFYALIYVGPCGYDQTTIIITNPARIAKHKLSYS